MKQVFADTFFYLAYLNPDDFAHDLAHRFGDREDLNFITTEYVLVEVADALSRPSLRTQAAAFIKHLRGFPKLLVVPSSTEILTQALDLFEHRADKFWSLTDCTSFIVMQSRSLTDALTGDHHFRQAGFNPLMLRQ